MSNAYKNLSSPVQQHKFNAIKNRLEAFVYCAFSWEVIWKFCAYFRLKCTVIVRLFSFLSVLFHQSTLDQVAFCSLPNTSTCYCSSVFRFVWSFWCKTKVVWCIFFSQQMSSWRQLSLLSILSWCCSQLEASASHNISVTCQAVAPQLTRIASLPILGHSKLPQFRQCSRLF